MRLRRSEFVVASKRRLCCPAYGHGNPTSLSTAAALAMRHFALA